MLWSVDGVDCSQRKRTKNTLSVFSFLGTLRAHLRNDLHIQELIESTGPVLFSGATRFTPFAVIGFTMKKNGFGWCTIFYSQSVNQWSDLDLEHFCNGVY